jgi:hypothetical protein
MVRVIPDSSEEQFDRIGEGEAEGRVSQQRKGESA